MHEVKAAPLLFLLVHYVNYSEEQVAQELWLNVNCLQFPVCQMLCKISKLTWQFSCLVFDWSWRTWIDWVMHHMTDRCLDVMTCHHISSHSCNMLVGAGQVCTGTNRPRLPHHFQRFQPCLMRWVNREQRVASTSCTPKVPLNRFDQQKYSSKLASRCSACRKSMIESWCCKYFQCLQATVQLAQETQFASCSK